MTATATPLTRPLLFRIAAREQGIVATCLALMCALAWWWLWRASASDAMTMTAMAPPGADANAGTMTYLGAAFVMWAIMMVAMMLPSAAPMILLHAGFARRGGGAPFATFAFALAYLLLWLGFAALAAIGQALLVSQGRIAAATLAFGSRAIIVALLVATALYQLSGLKRACLARCRSPLNFLIHHWRPGIAGAVRMGTIHGLYCIGCCGFLMLLLFVGGVMNLAWVALIAAVVLVEKYAPPRWHARWLIAGALLAAAGALALA